MAPSLEFHFFASNDLNGDPLLVITDEDEFFKSATLKPQLFGLGGLELTLARHTGFAIFDTDALRPEVFIRVLLKAYSETEYLPNVGAFLDKRSQIVVHVDENGAEEITLGGPGPKYYLDRYCLGIVENVGEGWTLELEDGVWRWDETATRGQILTRIIAEDAAGDAVALPDLTTSFGFINDSDSDPWIDILTGASEYEIPIGTSLLEAMWDMEDLGDFYTDISLGSVGAPEFVLNAYQTYGRDRTGTSFGTGVTLLKEGTNIANKGLELQGRSLKNVTHLIIEGKDGVWADVQKAGWVDGDYVKWGKITFNRSSKLEALHQAGIRWLRRQDSGEKNITVELLPGFDVDTGLYFPGPGLGIWLGDEVSVDTTVFAGGSPLDLNPSETQLVTGFEISTLDVMDDFNQFTRARSWEVKVQLNHERGGFSDSPNQSGTNNISRGRCCNHFAPICTEQEPDTETVLSDSVDDPSDWPGSLTTAGSCWGSANHKSMGASGGASAQISVSAGDIIRAELNLKEETGNDSWENVASYAYHAAMQFEGPGQPVLTYQIVNQLYHNTGCIDVEHSTTQTVPTGYTSARLRMYSRLGGWRYNGRLIEVTLADPVENDPFCLIGTGSSPYAARSDDPRFHSVHNAADVEIADAGSYFTGTDVEAALQELGAAAGGSGAPTTADYLVGTAQAGLSAEIVVGTAPGGELGGTWASPTVDATHSGSAHHSPNSVRKNSAGSTFTRTRLNLIEGSNVTLTVADDAVNDEVDVTIAASGGGSLTVQENDSTVDAAVTTLDFGNGLDVTSSPAGEANVSVDPSEIKLDDLGAPDDNTDLNATTSAHGLLLKLAGGTSSFLRADGTWAVPGAGGVSGNLIVIPKTADEIVNNSTALQDDNHLLYALAATGEWEFEVNLWYDASTTSDFKYAFTVPAGATIYWSRTGFDVSNAANNDASVVVASGTSAADAAQGVGTIRHLRIKGYVRTTGTAGNLQLQWAQSALSATDLTLHRGSTMKLWPLS